MSERKTILVTARGATVMNNHKTQITIGPVFQDVADFQLIGRDSPFSIRATILADQEPAVKALADEKGYITENDYALRLLR